MSQHYPRPNDVDVPGGCRPSCSLRRIIERDGQIVPVLVREVGGRFVAADRRQGERVLVIRELGWDSILVETRWTEEDL